MIWPFLTRWPFLTMGFWFRQVRSLRPTNLRSTYSSALSIRMRLDIDAGDDAGAFGPDDHAAVLGDGAFHAGATTGGSVRSSGTAWRCMLEPIKARLASSCSRNGISAAETETVCRGLMSTY